MNENEILRLLRVSNADEIGYLQWFAHQEKHNIRISWSRVAR